MKKIMIYIIVFMFMFNSFCVYAAQGRKGASDQAYEHASDQSVFNRVGDWFATVGKSDEEKQAIIMERKTKRAAKKAEKQAQKQKRKLEKETENVQKRIREKTRSMNK